jgi:hypothetical protein
MTEQRRECLSFGELADYWTADADVDASAIETHVFDCTACAQLLAEAEELRRGIRLVTRAGGVRAFVTDAVLNRLAREGVRMRSYTLEPGVPIQCSAWDEDEVMVARLRGDFTGVTAVDAQMRLDTGEDWGTAVDVPIRPGTTELVLALPAAGLRDSSVAAVMRLTLRASGSPGGILGEYIFEHEGSFDRE